MNGWVSTLTRNTSSMRINFPENTHDLEIEAFAWELTAKALQEAGRPGEAQKEQWELKPFDRASPTLGVSTARVRMHRK